MIACRNHLAQRLNIAARFGESRLLQRRSARLAVDLVSVLKRLAAGFRDENEQAIAIAQAVVLRPRFGVPNFFVGETTGYAL
jgi:hypothetical protein